MLFFRRMSEGHRTFRLRSTALLIGGLALASACGDDGNVGGSGGSGGATSSIASSGVQAGPTSATVTSSSVASQSSVDAASSVDASSSSGMGGQGGSGGGPNLPDYAPEMEPNNDFASANALPSGKLGFFGELDSGQDSDVFSIVAFQGDSLRVKISDGMGGCPPGNNTFQLQVFDSDDDEVASLLGECPTLDGTVDSDLGSLPADDTYFIRVTALTLVPFYVVEITVPPPVCGDGIKHATEECDDNNNVPGDGCDATCNREPVCGDGFTDNPPEECDDGNLADGDGCDANCLLEGNYCGEAEPNNNLGETNYIQGCDAVLAQISVVGDQDFFKFDVTVPGSSVRMEVTGLDPTTCPTGFDSVIYLYNPAGTQIASDDQSGVDSCSLINPVSVAAARNLPVGTYRAKVEDWQNNGTSPPYVFRLQVNAPGCGDGFVQSGEACDDGNTAAGDGCGPTCQFEGCAETEPNDTTATATSAATCNDLSGSISPVGDGDYYAVTVVEPGSSIRVETTQVGGPLCGTANDNFLRLYNAAGTELGTDNDDGDGSCALINPLTDAFATNLAAGTYYVKVEENGNNAVLAGYTVHIDVLAPVCGDGIVQTAEGEACDDGNTTAGDGCNATCQVEGCAEIEPNNTTATATSTTSCNDFNGAITPVGDGDYYAVTVVEPGSSIRVETSRVGGATCGTANDNFLRLYDAIGTELGTDNDDGDGTCALINPLTDAFAANLAVGTYYVKVEENGNNATLAGYAVHIDVLLPECGDSIVQPGEECDDGNLVDGDFCDSMCQLPPGICDEIEPNDSVATANPFGSCILMRGEITLAGGTAEGDYFSIEVTVPGSSIYAETVTANGVGCPTGADSVIRLFGPTGTELGSDDQDGIDSCSLIRGGTDAFARNLPVGVYTVRVEDWQNNGAIPAYGLILKAIPPSCGDGIVQPPEDCDDGNLDLDDACTNMCTATPMTPESEPNATIATADAQTPGTHGFTGSISPIGDEDYYAIEVPAGADLRLETGAVPFGGSCPGDLEIFFYSPTGTLLASDDDDSDNGTCSLLVGANDPVMNNLAGGTYYVRVERHLDSSTVGSYTLFVTITP